MSSSIRPMESTDSLPLLSDALSPDFPANLSEALKAPTYDRSALARSIVHIGVGGFHRAHLAVYVDELCRAGNTDWAIVGTGVMPGDSAMKDALSGQDHLYTVVERSAEGHDATIIGSMIDFIHAHPDAAGLIDAIAAPETQIVSMTVTEGGYPVDDATGDFDPDSPNAGPNSAFAAIIAGLTKRMNDGVGPVTILSCDNVMGNGDVAALATKSMAAAASPELSAWIEENVAFPNSMVDRITPATTDSDREWFADNIGIADNWPVVCEPFIQWVIEDNYAGARPPWETLDIIITEDVRPFEHMKLQLLNAGHSLLGFAAHLFEIELVHDGMADPDVLAFVEAYLNREAKTSLHPVEGMDFDEYINILLERFANPQVRDQILRLAMDGTSRIPKFVLPTLRTHLATAGQPSLQPCSWQRGARHCSARATPATTSSSAPTQCSTKPKQLHKHQSRTRQRSSTSRQPSMAFATTPTSSPSLWRRLPQFAQTACAQHSRPQCSNR